MADKYLEKAKEIAGDKVKTKEGLFSLRNDLREAYNHFFPEPPSIINDYIEFCLENKLYDIDPYAMARLKFYTLERLVKDVEFESYVPSELFTLKNIKTDEKNFDGFVNELFEKRIIRKETL